MIPDWMVGATHPFDSVLVANRGEIAVRVLRAASEAGLRGVAVYSDPDEGALHVEVADEAVYLPGETLGETYLNSEAIIQAAKDSGAQAIHPGYGFLSERADFARMVAAAGLVWIGPPTESIETMGDKISARRRMIDSGVPVIPGEELAISEDADHLGTLAAAAARVGYPLLIKASAGGRFPGAARSLEWTEGTLTQAIGRAVIGALGQADLLKNMSWVEAEKQIRVAERAGGYVRIFLENADEESCSLFTEAMANVFGPVKDARYLIQREADFEYTESRFAGTWVLDKTPGFISSFIAKRTQVTKRRREVVKVHAVPKILARNKDRALIFQKNWNLHVSPGSVWFYTHEGTKSMLQEAGEKDWLPDSTVQQKEVFM